MIGSGRLPAIIQNQPFVSPGWQIPGKIAQKVALYITFTLPPQIKYGGQ